ncbi:hypothetical protein [Legionella saoudiensis]|uniref:hypothetical protein n=1 Tax=Legionella saoudiensis TaxID=1750561 RepID=UPI000AF93372|nr:hypothetical protein [Legionella saoudiensis]
MKRFFSCFKGNPPTTVPAKNKKRRVDSKESLSHIESGTHSEIVTDPEIMRELENSSSGYWSVPSC